MDTGAFEVINPLGLFFVFIVGSFVLGLFIGYVWVQLRRWQMVWSSGIEMFPFDHRPAYASRNLGKVKDVFQPNFKPMPTGFHPLKHARV